MRKYLILTMTCLLLMTGCAGTQIVVNGAPPANHLVILESPETGILAFSHIIRLDAVREGDEKREDLTYFGPGQIEIKSNTRSLYVAVRVLNEEKHVYSIWHIYDVVYPNETYPYHVEHMIYSGRLSSNNETVYYPIKNVVSGISRLEIRDGEGDPMIVIGNVVYKQSNNHGKEEE